jgi:hypothetical protein
MLTVVLLNVTFIIVILSFIMLSVVTLNVTSLNDVAPNRGQTISYLEPLEDKKSFIGLVQD